MANNLLIERPTGLPAVIQSMQKRIYAGLLPKWAVLANGDPNTDFVLEGYGKAYTNKKDKVVIAEAFINDSEKDYTGSLLTSDVTKFFFIESGRSRPEGQTLYRTSLDVCFIVDLSEIKPGITSRAVAEAKAHADVEKILKDLSIFNAQIEGFDTGFKNLFIGLDHTPAAIDYQPKHAFKFTLGIVYNMQTPEC